MPFQNTGTLLENLVVLEAARVLLRATAAADGPLTVATAFAMPPRGPWRYAAKYAHEDVFTDAVLDRLAAADPADLAAAPTSYAALLARCLRDDRAQGPNAALLVGLLAQRLRRPVRLWLNDLPDARARYGPSLPSRDALQATLHALAPDALAPDALALDALAPDSDTPADDAGDAVPEGGEADAFEALAAVRTCDTPYPDSFGALRDALATWAGDDREAARLGFLDPNVYHAEGRDGPQTARADHRAWLRTLATAADGDAFDRPLVAAHFTAKRDLPTLRADLKRLHADGQAAGYPVSCAYRHRHYAVAVNVRGCAGCDPNALADALDAAMVRAWQAWHAAALQRPDDPAVLHAYADGQELDVGLT